MKLPTQLFILSLVLTFLPSLNAQSSISFGMIATNGFISDEWVRGTNDGDSYTWGENFSGLHLSFDFPVGKRTLLQASVSYRSNRFTYYYEGVEFEGMKYQRTFDRIISFAGAGASIKRFFNDNYRNFYVVGGGQLHFSTSGRDVTFLRDENNSISFGTTNGVEVADEYKSVVPSFHLAVGYRLYLQRIYFDLNLGASIKPVALYENIDVGHPIWRRIELSAGYQF